jgi:hypothetical protein
METMAILLCSLLLGLPLVAGEDGGSRASGAFDVTVTPLPAEEKDGKAGIPRFAIAKRYHGDLEATADAEMLVSGSPSSGAYVAIENVRGALAGRKGTFALQHSGTADRGAQSLSITVVPDSGTGDLKGLSGRMSIRIEKDGKHFYELRYSIGPHP